MMAVKNVDAKKMNVDMKGKIGRASCRERV